MGKFDGMDPALVRDLLAEVKRAAEQMRTVESRVTRLMSGAGLSSQSAHRPVQVADECDTMVRDVSARVALLEKKVRQDADPTPGPKAAGPESGTPEARTPAPQRPEQDEPRAGTPGSEEPKTGGTPAPEAPGQKPEEPKTGTPAPETSKQDPPKAEAPRTESAPQTPRTEDLKPAVPESGGNPRWDGSQAGDQPRAEAPRTEAPESGTGPGTDSRGEGDFKGESGSKGDDRSIRIEDPPRDAPRTQPDSTPDLKPEADSKGDDRSPRGGDPAPGAPGADDVRDAKPDTGSKGDERSPRGDGGGPEIRVPDGGTGTDSGTGTDPGTGTDSGTGSGAGDVPDTRQKDHPDDIDQSGALKPQVVEVDGVKVLQIPLDPPSAEQVEALLEKIEDVAPMDMPSVEGVSQYADTRPGQVEPHGPLPSAKPDVPLLDTVGPAEDQTVQPPGTGGETGDRSTGTKEAPDGSGGSGGSGTSGGPGGSGTSGGSDGAGGSGGAEDSGARERADGSGGTGGAGTPGGSLPDGGADAAPRWTTTGDVVSVRVDLPDLEAIRTLADNARAIEPLEMPGVQVPDGETWGEGAWAAMEVGPDGSPGEAGPQDPRRPVPPPGGGSSGGQSV
ncbi:hypothetical protein Ppa06_34430 [Planomonospora parontospora subsp. parontospora]|uniref:Uncharacterized protein n=2 Tax=Planomonospora parontospora TaxID=58119 RepID=A0AA37F5L1_9ACTN|nr:hypothetical protein [Planomonospora parontospora]GGK73891.1 hypothetical protein GCM10010126_36650 [Planomonospora parontospora]GII09645.1 hypothetical protein Ppa06_34430 [Planomonospora parontospora subsp. parontospora]